MREEESITSDELRPEYQRSEFWEMVRGKYAAQLKKDSAADQDPGAGTPSSADVIPTGAGGA